MCDEGEEGNTKLQRRIEVLEIARTLIEEAAEEITLEGLISKVLERCSEKITEERVQRYIIESPANIIQSLERINQQLKEQKSNYTNLEKAIIHTALLDAVTNNLDRHLSNWAIIRDKNTGKCSLAVFDNTLSFINMSSSKPLAINGKWAESSIHIDSTKKHTSQKEVCEYIARNYPQHLSDFIDVMKDKLPEYEKAIGMPKVPDEEYKLLSDEEKAQCGSYRKPIMDDMVIADLRSKVKTLEEMLKVAIEEQFEEMSQLYSEAEEYKKPGIRKTLEIVRKISQKLQQQGKPAGDGR